MHSTSSQSARAVYLRGYCARYVGVESVALAEARRTGDYQTTVFDCVNNLLERCAENQDDKICIDDNQGKDRVTFLAICNNLVTLAVPVLHKHLCLTPSIGRC